MGWMDLPQELLELIFQRLSLVDEVMNCRATCRSWRKLGDAVFSSQLPLMMSLSTPYTCAYWPYPPRSYHKNFGSLSAPWRSNHDSSVLTQTWPKVIDATNLYGVYSVQGWLMFNIISRVNVTVQTFCEPSFFNPFSRARFKLPKLFLFFGILHHHLIRVAFNSAPPRSEEFVVAFLCVFSYKQGGYTDPPHTKQRLAFIKLKQGSWIECNVETAEIFDDIQVHDDNKLYGLTFKHGTRVVFVFTLGNDDHVVERLEILNTIENIEVSKYFLTNGAFKRNHQIVMDTSTGELLLVRHDVYDSIQSEVFDSIRTKGFRVFKLDRSNRRWCEVSDIGEDRFLLWDYTQVSFVSTKGLRLEERFKRGNCVFFCHANNAGDGQCLKRRTPFPEHDMGVFFLADRTITHFPIPSSLPLSHHNMWFTPAP